MSSEWKSKQGDEKYFNMEKHRWRRQRRIQLLNDDRLDLINNMEEIDYYLDSDHLALEGLEIANGSNDDISVSFVLTRASGRLYIDIDEAIDNQTEDPVFDDETVIKRHDHGWVPLRVVDT